MRRLAYFEGDNSDFGLYSVEDNKLVYVGMLETEDIAIEITSRFNNDQKSSMEAGIKHRAIIDQLEAQTTTDKIRAEARKKAADIGVKEGVVIEPKKVKKKSITSEDEVPRANIIVRKEYDTLLKGFQFWAGWNKNIALRDTGGDVTSALLINFANYSLGGLKALELKDPVEESWENIVENDYLAERYDSSDGKWINLTTGEEHE